MWACVCMGVPLSVPREVAQELVVVKREIANGVYVYQQTTIKTAAHKMS